MAVGITHILTVLSLVQCTVKVEEWSDVATPDLLKQREEEQLEEMTWLMEKMEKMSQETHGLVQENTLVAACQNWWFWVSAEALLMLFGLYWLPRKQSSDSNSGSQKGTSSGAQEQGEEEQDF